MIDDYEDWVEDGQERIALLLRDLIFANDSELLEKLDPTDVSTFLEPHLFAFYNSMKSPSVTLHQALYGYFTDKKDITFDVFSNSDGTVYLPNSRLLRTNCSMGRLTYSERNGALELRNEKEIVTYKSHNLSLIKDTTFELLTHKDEALRVYFRNEKGEITQVSVLDSSILKEKLSKALQIIKVVFPEYYSMLELTTRKFYLYNGAPNSFATINAHGIAFLNVQHDNDLAYFIDNIVHQCGHIIFNTISFEKEKWFTVNPLTPICEISTNSHGDNADLYGRYHGLFTQTNVNTCIDRCLDSNLLFGKELYELEGRLASNMKRFQLALQKLNIPHAYTEIGRSWYDFFNSTYQVIYEKRKDIINKYKVDNQPYVFNYDVFQRSNKQLINSLI